LIAQAKKYEELQRLLQSDHYDLLVIDSVNDMGLTTEQFENLCANETATIFIQQSTKTGDYKGSTKLAHDTDIVLRIENQEVEVEKTRFK
jgi:predicted ATP-dependent serine protease